MEAPCKRSAVRPVDVGMEHRGRRLNFHALECNYCTVLLNPFKSDVTRLPPQRQRWEGGHVVHKTKL